MQFAIVFLVFFLIDPSSIFKLNKCNHWFLTRSLARSPLGCLVFACTIPYTDYTENGATVPRATRLSEHEQSVAVCCVAKAKDCWQRLVVRSVYLSD